MDENETEALTTTTPPSSAASTFAVLEALQEVGKAELAKGPGIASNAWRKLIDTIGELFGDDALGHAVPVVGRQPVAMPPGYKHAIPPKGGAQPLVKPAPTIKERADVAAELERVKRGGKP